MRRSFLLVVLIFWMTGSIGASAPGGRVCREGLCISIDAPEPVRFGEPVLVKITVTSEMDIKNLGMNIVHDVDVLVDSTLHPEADSVKIDVYTGGATWITDIRAGEELTFVRSLALPRREGWFAIVADALKPDSTRVVHSLTIHYTPEESTVYLSGTRIPGTTEGPMLTMDPDSYATLAARASETPTQTVTPFPTTGNPPLELLGTPAYPPPPGTPYP